MAKEGNLSQSGTLFLLFVWRHCPISEEDAWAGGESGDGAGEEAGHGEGKGGGGSHCLSGQTSRGTNDSVWYVFSCPSSSRPTLVTYLLTVTFIVLDSKPSSLPDQTGNLTKLRGDRNLAKLMGVMRKHELPNKNTTAKTNTKTMTNTFREHLQRAIFATFDLWDNWSEWWENMTWPTKRQRQRQIQRQWQIHLENIFKEQSLGLLTIETFDQSGEKTSPDQQKDNKKDKDKYI